MARELFLTCLPTQVSADVVVLDNKALLITLALWDAHPYALAVSCPAVFSAHVLKNNDSTVAQFRRASSGKVRVTLKSPEYSHPWTQLVVSGESLLLERHKIWHYVITVDDKVGSWLTLCPSC
jgi:hypothetical protein